MIDRPNIRAATYAVRWRRLSVLSVGVFCLAAASPAVAKHEHVISGWGHGLGFGDYVDGRVHPFAHSSPPTLKPSFTRVDLYENQRRRVTNNICNYCQDLHFTADVTPSNAECRYQALIHINNVTNRHLHFHNKDCSIPIGDPALAQAEIEGRAHGLLYAESGSY